MTSLIQQIVELTKPYLGINAERFVLRQITTHLNITPEQLSASKLNDLAKWVEISASLLIDKEKAKELSDKIATFK